LPTKQQQQQQQQLPMDSYQWIYGETMHIYCYLLTGTRRTGQGQMRLDKHRAKVKVKHFQYIFTQLFTLLTFYCNYSIPYPPQSFREEKRLMVLLVSEINVVQKLALVMLASLDMTYICVETVYMLFFILCFSSGGLQRAKFSSLNTVDFNKYTIFFFFFFFFFLRGVTQSSGCASHRRHAS